MKQSDAKRLIREPGIHYVTVRGLVGRWRVVGVAFALAKGLPVSRLDVVPDADTTTEWGKTYIDDNGTLRKIPTVKIVPVRDCQFWSSEASATAREGR
jgi:hypothetical protein